MICIKQKYERGFTALVAILIVVTISALGVAGWTAYQANQPTEVEVTEQNQEDAVEQEERTQEAGESEGYLIVSEWDVKVPINGDTKDLYYKIEPGRVEVLNFRSKQYDAVVGDCNQAAVSLTRGQAHEPEPYSGQSTYKETYERNRTTSAVMLHIGNYYYLAIHKSSSCLEGKSQVDAELEQVKYIKQAVKKLEKL